MDMLSVLTVLSVLCLTPDVFAEWAYSGDDGPKEWHEEYPMCGGERQSPINIDTQTAEYDSSLKFFDFSSYNVSTDTFNMTLENDGGKAAKVIYSGSPLYLKGGSLPGPYKLVQFHFHWGEPDERGSEHAKNFHLFPMEMHLVHSGLGPRYKLAVLAFWVEVGSHNLQFEKLLDSFGQIRNPGDQYQIPSFPITDLLPDPNGMDYFRYGGSLTTPPCNETVLWSVSSTRLTISENQIEIFRGLLEERGGQETIEDNFRPLQQLNGRKVKTSSDVKDSEFIAQKGKKGKTVEDGKGGGKPLLGNPGMVICTAFVLLLKSVA